MSIENQKTAFDDIYLKECDSLKEDKLHKYLKNRRLKKSLKVLNKYFDQIEINSFKTLVVCGGGGEEAIWLKDQGISDVTNSDFSEYALQICAKNDPEIKNLQLNAENIDVQDMHYDLVIVQDGLHHLPRPVLGLNEMIRISKKAVIVIEPCESIISMMLGKKWEIHDGCVNWVFRWNRGMFLQVIKSQLLQFGWKAEFVRIIDHGSTIGNICIRLAEKNGAACNIAKFIYKLLSPFNNLGNNSIGVIIKE
jgi:ubiquinone/menaquinone biosynthesis C-methylase UbiE